MDEKKFMDVEEKFKLLSNRYKNGEINSDTLKTELKKMMILDEEGKYWMLGGKTGKWYIYNGKEWNEDNPYKNIVEKKEVTDSFETVLFERNTSKSAIDSGTLPIKESSSTLKVETVSANQESDSDDVDLVLGQEDKSDYDFEVVSNREYVSDADIEAVSPREEDKGSDFEVLSTQDEIRHSDFELDLTGEENPAGHEVILPRENSDDSELEVVSIQEDSSVLADDIIEPGPADGNTTRAEKFFPDDSEDSDFDTGTMGNVPGDNLTDVAEIAPGEIKKVPRQDTAAAKVTKKVAQIDELVIHSIDMISMLFFLGGIGLIIGVLFGATFGIFTGVFGDLIYYFPELLRDAQGGIAGGLIFAAIGGIAGFITFAVLGVFISSIYNLIAFIFGGIRIKIK